MTYKLNISKPTSNVLTATNADDLIFSSDYGTLKYLSEGSGSTLISVPSAGDSQVYEATIVNHNLGYYPFFAAFLRNDGDTLYYIMPVTFADAGFWKYEFVYATTSSLIYHVDRGNVWGYSSNAYSVYIYYKIFKNNLNL